MDWRCIHDSDASLQAENMRASLNDASAWLQAWQSRGYGVFVCINEMDGNGRKLNNVKSVRTHIIDLDNMSARQNLDLAASAEPAPWFGVNTSPNKYHVYWPVAAYRDNERYTRVQRKLRQAFDGDKKVIDPTRVLRVPGSYHLKDPQNPFPVSVWAMRGYNNPIRVENLESALSHIVAIDTVGDRKPLGDETLAAPSIEWIKHGLDLVDPNDLDREEWIAMLAAVKQSGWTLASDEQLFDIFSSWCQRYEHNNIGENRKQWNSIKDSQLGWKSMCSRIPGLSAALSFQGVDTTVKQTSGFENTPSQPQTGAPAMPIPEPPKMDCSGPYLNHLEIQEWFKGFHYVLSEKKMMSPTARFLDQGQFNALMGGKKFIIDEDSKTTLVPWEAVTKSTLWQIPKVDHVRFLPSTEFGAITVDNLGRDGINLYKPSIINPIQGDASRYIRHVAMLLPDVEDQRKLHTYLGHNIQHPGFKIPWAPVIQSSEGAGKGVFKRLMREAMGSSYVHYPNAKELADSGSKFNAWMRHKLFLIADEIKVDDRREMIEILKDMITEEQIEMQPKGVDQKIEDNYSNWLFFTNWKNAVPTTKNGRRFAIFYTAIQSMDDLLVRQMGKSYFDDLYNWMDNEDGAAIVANWYRSLDIPYGSIDMRAPTTSSTAEALIKSRSPVEAAIHEAIEAGRQGFRGGWISSLAINKRLVECDMRKISQGAMGEIMDDMGYFVIGRALAPMFEEDPKSSPMLFAKERNVNLTDYAGAQGYAR